MLLPDRRRFCLRQHVLLVLPPLAGSARPRGFSHRDVILLPHSAPDPGDLAADASSGEVGGGGGGGGEADGSDTGGDATDTAGGVQAGSSPVSKAAYVQQAGKARDQPTPSLLGNTDPTRPRALEALRRPVPGLDADALTRRLEDAARAVLQGFVQHAHHEYDRTRAGTEAASACGEGAAKADAKGQTEGERGCEGNGEGNGGAPRTVDNSVGAAGGVGVAGVVGGTGGVCHAFGPEFASPDTWYYNLFGFDAVVEGTVDGAQQAVGDRR